MDLEDKVVKRFNCVLMPDYVYEHLSMCHKFYHDTQERIQHDKRLTQYKKQSQSSGDFREDAPRESQSEYFGYPKTK
jgi:hypothetical protein